MADKEFNVKGLPSGLKWQGFQRATSGQFTKEKYGTTKKANDARSEAWDSYNSQTSSDDSSGSDSDDESVADKQKELEELLQKQKEQELEDKKEAHEINKEYLKLKEKQFLDNFQYKKACEDKDIQEYKEYQRAMAVNKDATAFNRSVSEDNYTCITSSECTKKLKEHIIRQCDLGIRVNILHGEGCAIPADIKELQDAQNALNEKRKTLVKEFTECKTQLMNEWRDKLENRNRFRQFIGWLRGDTPDSLMKAIEGGSELPKKKMKRLVSIFKTHAHLLSYERNLLGIQEELFQSVKMPAHEPENDISNISKRIQAAEQRIDDFRGLQPRQYKWRLTYRYLPIFVVPYAEVIKAKLAGVFSEDDFAFGTIEELIANGQYEDASFELIEYMKRVHIQGVHVKFFDVLSRTIGGLSQSNESEVCAHELGAFHRSLLHGREEKQDKEEEHPYVSITSLPYSPLHIEWLELKKRLRELFDKNSGYKLAIKAQEDAMKKLDKEQKELDKADESSDDEEDGSPSDDSDEEKMGGGGEAKDGDSSSDSSTPAPFDIWRSNEVMDNIIRDHVGMENIKRHCFTLYKNRLAQVSETEAAQPELPLNFQFIGNPGTGKTTIARLLGDLLFHTSLRPATKPREMPTPPTGSSGGMGKRAGNIGWNVMTGNWFGAGSQVLMGGGSDAATNKAAQVKYELELAKLGPPEPYFQEESAASLLVMKAEGVTGLLNSMREQGGGILFVDEAYSLDPEDEDEGKKIFDLIMTAAENDRKTMTIILAGYKREIEKKLNAFNPGLPRRFPSVYEFHDYSDDELFQILQLMLKKTRRETSPDKYSGWRMKDAVAHVLIRRIARQRGVHGFGNAGTVRNQMYDKIMTASARLGLGIDQGPGIDASGTVTQKVDTGTVLEVTIGDVIGPNPVDNRRVTSALAKLDDFVGLVSVKADIRNLVDVAAKNWRRESACLAPFPVMLNRLFVGKPGTGKTSIATIYGEILGAVGYLTDGSVKATVASDYVGSYSGEAQKKTVAIMEATKGKVLIIDEAYVLSQSEYGRQALDVLVERVSPKPGTDMAVILAGYKENILKMCREENPGLGRRFDVSHPIVFEDYDDDALEEILRMKCRKERIICPPAVRKAVIKKIAMQRQQASFGNAGEVENMLSRAKRNAIERSDSGFMLSLTAEDFDIADIPDIDSVIETLSKQNTTPEIVAHIRRLRQQHDFYKRLSAPMPSPGHYVFMGNSGTGKTFIAKAMGQVFYQLGIVSSSEMVITSAPDLMGTVVGEAQKLVRKKMEQALGGTLFIDEAYQLGKGQYGEEAQTQLIATLEEDKYKHNIIVILAGYKQEMNGMMARNQGMRSRFTQQFEIRDWDVELCVQFTKEELQKRYCTLGPDTEAVLRDYIDRLKRQLNFANGRDCKNIATKISEFAYANADSAANGAAIVSRENIHNALQPMIEIRSRITRVVGRSEPEQKQAEPMFRQFTHKHMEYND